MQNKYTKGCFCTNEKISFREHLEPLLRCAEEFYRTSTAKGALCIGAGLEPARWSEFEKGKKNFTGYYVYKILQSLKMTEESYMEATGMAFTEEQIKELQAQKFIQHHRGFIDDLVALESPETIELFKKVLKNPEMLDILRKLFE